MQFETKKWFHIPKLKIVKQGIFFWSHIKSNLFGMSQTTFFLSQDIQLELLMEMYYQVFEHQMNIVWQTWTLSLHNHRTVFIQISEHSKTNWKIKLYVFPFRQGLLDRPQLDFLFMWLPISFEIYSFISFEILTAYQFWNI